MDTDDDASERRPSHIIVGPSHSPTIALYTKYTLSMNDDVTYSMLLRLEACASGASISRGSKSVKSVEALMFQVTSVQKTNGKKRSGARTDRIIQGDQIECRRKLS